MFRLKIIVLSLLFTSSAMVFASGEFDRINEVGIRELKIEGGLLNVEIRGSSRLGVEGHGENIPDSVEVKYERRGSVLRVWVERRFALFAVNRNGKLVFNVPDSIDLEVRTGSGSIDIENMSSDDLFAGASSGSVRIAGIRSELEVESSSGRIIVEDVRGDTRIEASSGNIEAREIKGDLDVTASSGRIWLYDIDGDIEASSSSGGIEIEGAKGAIDAHSSSGRIEGDEIWITGDSVFKASSGNINIDFDNPLSAFSFRLSSTSGGLHAGNRDGQKNLNAGAGLYRITGETSSGSQRYR